MPGLTPGAAAPKVYESLDLTSEILSAKPNADYSVTKCMYGTIAIRPKEFGLSEKEAVPGVFITAGIEDKADSKNKGTVSLICFLENDKPKFILSPNNSVIHGSQPESEYKAYTDEAHNKMHPDVAIFNPFHPENRHGIYSTDSFPVNIKDEKLLNSIFLGHISDLDKIGSTIVGDDVQNNRDAIRINEPVAKKPGTVGAIVDSLIEQLHNDVQAIVKGDKVPSKALHIPDPSMSDADYGLPWALISSSKEDEKLKSMTPEEAYRSQSALHQQVYDVAGPQGNIELDKRIDRFPCLVVGDHGSGKTYMCEQLGDIYEKSGAKYIKICCNSKQQAPDLFGTIVPTTNENGDRVFIWQDGPLTSAVRNASQGRETFLLMDEFFQLNKQMQADLKAFLSPNDKNEYQIRTGRTVDVKDGVGTVEELRCPISRLTIVGTANIGEQYDVQVGDPAVLDRFSYTFQKDSERATVENVVHKSIKTRNFSPKTEQSVMKFYDQMRKLAADKTGDMAFANLPNARTLTKAIRSAVSEDRVVDFISYQKNAWAARNLEGKPIPEQIEQIDLAIKKSFGR